MQWQACLGYQGVSVLAKWGLFSVCALQPSARLLGSDPAQQTTDAPPAMHLILPLLDQLHRDQTGLREAIEQLGRRQEAVSEQQTKGIREQLNVARTLFGQWERDLEALRAHSRATLTTVALVAGVFLLGVGYLTWGLFRTLQGFSAWVSRMSPGPMLYLKQTPLWGPPDGGVMAVIEQMERRLLKLENLTGSVVPGEGGKLASPIAPSARPALPPGAASSAGGPAAGTGQTLGPLPGDFV